MNRNGLRILAFGAILPLLACAGEEPRIQESSDSSFNGACSADAAAFVEGETYSEALGEEAREAAGARVLRVIRPGQMVTMDYRADRLNLELDEDGEILRTGCG